MRLERLNYNKIKIFLTFDDLYERGITKEDIWKDSLKWQYLFHEMLEQANDTLGIEIHGNVAVEIFSMQAQGMIMILTMCEDTEDEELLQEGFIEMQVTVDETAETLFSFADIEDVINLSQCLLPLQYTEGSLYWFENKYYLYFPSISVTKQDQLVSILAEYGQPSFVSIAYLQEYGKEIMKKDALSQLDTYFS